MELCTVWVKACHERKVHTILKPLCFPDLVTITQVLKKGKS